MDEQAIAQQQILNIPQPTEHTPAAITASELTGFGAATIQLDEMTQYKLHDLFELQYSPTDEDSRQQLQYIYDKVSDMVEDKDYPFIASKIRELMRVAGIAHGEKKIYKLYEWLRLSNVMKTTDAEMQNLRDL